MNFTNDLETLFKSRVTAYIQSLKLNNQFVNTNFSLDSLNSRLNLALTYFEPKLDQILQWLSSSREQSNFTYAISQSNKDYLAAFFNVITGLGLETIKSYINELDSDLELKLFIKSHRETLASRGMAIDDNFDFGRRLGWYVAVRALKPKVVVETGIDQGLGSLVLTCGLLKNRSEGFQGHYYGTDFNPLAGYLLQPPYSSIGTVLYGDSIESLKSFNQKIDLFINDSDHSASYEYQEYLTIASKLSEEAIIIGDNSHVTDSLCRFASESDLKFLFFKEQPESHWYPGAGIGVAFK